MFKLDEQRVRKEIKELYHKEASEGLIETMKLVIEATLSGYEKGLTSKCLEADDFIYPVTEVKTA